MIVAQTANASSTALNEMVHILLHLEHYPSSGDKLILKKIVDNESSTKQERVLASSITNFKHNVNGQDKEKLIQLVEDKNVKSEDRELASIVLSINHMPSETERARLEKIIR